ncbi:hypothetical protein QQP08_013194 [Theobroma cacao]|nr:hypothetical protein QQP08_013194 [Theobroma cacao]
MRNNELGSFIYGSAGDPIRKGTKGKGETEMRGLSQHKAWQSLVAWRRQAKQVSASLLQMQSTAAVSLGPRSGASSAEQVAMAKEEIKEMLMELEEEGRLCLGQLPFRKPLIRCFNNRLSVMNNSPERKKNVQFILFFL